MPTVPYEYIRALELEGRHPRDAGCWPQTMHRLEIGEGTLPPDNPSAFIAFDESEPFPTTKRATEKRDASVLLLPQNPFIR